MSSTAPATEILEVAPATPRPIADRRRGGRLHLSVATWRLLALAVLLAVWHLASMAVGKLLLPSPLEVAFAFVELVRTGQLVGALASSLVVFAAGYALAVLSGVALGVLMGGVPRLGATLEIYVNALNTTPRIALIPLIVLWFGLGVEAKIVVVWFQALFPILINTYAGVTNTDQELVEAARSFGARQSQVFRHIMLPGAVPYIVTGLRLGGSNAMVGTVIAELYTALSGLGYLIAQYGNSFQTAKFFAPVLVLSALGIVLSQALKALERHLARWRHTSLEI